MENGLLFYERQHWNIWVWLLLALTNAVVIIAVRKQSAKIKTGGIVFIILMLLLSVVFLNFRLDMQIRTDGVYVRFFPVHISYKKYSWKEISESSVVNYEPVKEYGGWGIRGRDGNRALTISGDKGLQLIFANGNKLLIGTEEPVEIEIALKIAKQFN